MSNKFLVEVSARHSHLDQETVELLFGKGHTLTPIRDLSQPGEFVCQEKIDIIGAKNTIQNVAVLGPTRSRTQVEVSLTDSYVLGHVAPVRDSGDIVGSQAIRLRGSIGEVELKEGLIIAKRHIHMTPDDAERLGVTDKQSVFVAVDTARSVIFGDTIVRVNSNYKLAMHTDTDEANAAGIGREGCEGEIIAI